MDDLVKNLEDEEWRYVPDTNNKYMASNKGRIKHIIKQHYDMEGNQNPVFEQLLYSPRFLFTNMIPITYVKEDGGRLLKGVDPYDILAKVYPEIYGGLEEKNEPMHLEGEIWKDVPETDGRYQVSNKGRLKAKAHVITRSDGLVYHQNEKLLKVPVDKYGYKRTVLFLGRDDMGNRKVKCVTIHRLVAELFHDNPENKEQVNHIDGIKTNNDMTNLEWNTPKENVQHAFRTGLAHAKQGVEANRAKIKNDEDIERLKDMYFSGKTADEVGAVFGISNTEVLDIVQGNRFKSHFSQEEYDRRMANRVVENKQVGLMHPRCKADPERIKEVLELYHSGMQIKEIAKKYGVNRHAVGRWIHSSWGGGEALATQAGMSHSQTKVTPELYRKACEMRDQGFTPNYIGAKLGFNRNTIVKWFSKPWYKELLSQDNNSESQDNKNLTEGEQ